MMTIMYMKNCYNIERVYKFKKKKWITEKVFNNVIEITVLWQFLKLWSAFEFPRQYE